jgi:hypothetical protein
VKGYEEQNDLAVVSPYPLFVVMRSIEILTTCKFLVIGTVWRTCSFLPQTVDLTLYRGIFPFERFYLNVFLSNKTNRDEHL